MDPEKLVAEILKVVRGEMAMHDLSQAKLAAKIGIHPGVLQRYLAGTREMPIGILMQIAEAMDTTAADLMASGEARYRKSLDKHE